MQPPFTGDVLIIEDTQSVNLFFNDSLAKLGFNTESAFTAEEAKEKLAQKEYDYVLLDLILPDGDGEQLLATHNNLKVIVLTSDDDPQRRERLFQLGIIDYFTKENPLDYILKQLESLFQKLVINSQYKILIVDDSRSVREVARSSFEIRNYEVTTCGDGKEALEHIHQTHYDLALLDLHLPDMSGDELLTMVRSDKKLHDLPVIVISGTTNADLIAKVLKHGANEFIRKPFSFEELVLKSEILLSMSRSEKLIQEKNRQLESMNENLRQMVDEEVRKREEQFQDMVFNARMIELGEMIGAITHQWMQPLNSLYVAMQDLQDVYHCEELNEEYMHRFLDRSMKQIDFMSKTIQDFRNFYRKENHPEIFPIEKVISEVLLLVGGIFIKSSIEIRFEENIENPHYCWGYPNEFRHVILNMLNNSKDAILKNRTDYKGYIEIKVSKGEGVQRITIQDNGGGIPDEIKDNIFSSYFSTKGDKGTGVGLTMSKTIIQERFNGSIGFENIADGVRFSIQLPTPNL